MQHERKTRSTMRENELHKRRWFYEPGADKEDDTIYPLQVLTLLIGGLCLL